MADTLAEYLKQLLQPAVPATDPVDQLMVLATGRTPDQLHVEGGAAYPTENNAENQGGHRLASKLMTDKFGPVVSQLAGVANEGLEATNNKAVQGKWFPYGVGEPMRDLGANWRGMTDSVRDTVDNDKILNLIRRTFSSRAK